MWLLQSYGGGFDSHGPDQGGCSSAGERCSDEAEARGASPLSRTDRSSGRDKPTGDGTRLEPERAPALRVRLPLSPLSNPLPSRGRLVGVSFFGPVSIWVCWPTVYRTQAGSIPVRAATSINLLGNPLGSVWGRWTAVDGLQASSILVGGTAFWARGETDHAGFLPRALRVQILPSLPMEGIRLDEDRGWKPRAPDRASRVRVPLLPQIESGLSSNRKISARHAGDGGAIPPSSTHGLVA